MEFCTSASAPATPIYKSFIHPHIHRLPSTLVEIIPPTCSLAHIISQRYDTQLRRGTVAGSVAFTTPVLGVWAGCAGASGMGTSEKSSWEMALIVHVSALR